MASRVRLLPALAALFALACATPVGVDEKSPRVVRRELTASVLTTGELSAVSRRVLQRIDLAQRYEDEPEATLALLHARLATAPYRRELLVAMAELSFQQAERRHDRGRYLAAAIYAYAYLFPHQPEERPSAWDPDLRLAAELYNQALGEGLRAEGSPYVEIADRTEALPFGSLAIDVDETKLLWGGYRLQDFLVTVGFDVRGLRNRYRRSGVGAALIAGIGAGDGKLRAGSHRIPESTRVPVTAFLRLPDLDAGLESGQVRGRLEIFGLDHRSTIQVEGVEAPLEYDPSAAIAYGLEANPLWDFELQGFMVADMIPFRGVPDGLVLSHPYRPGRVPVVLIHGTASSPARWAELVNELRGDPVLDERIQIWMFSYATGNPILVSAARLRDALAATVAELDPAGTDPALREMVLIGHSQGGLIAKLQAVSPGDAFYDDWLDRPFAEAKLLPETRSLVADVAFFRASPFVRRILYLATPHGGSYQAQRRLAGLVAGLIELPFDVTRTVGEYVALPADEARLRGQLQRSTSIENMRPGSDFQKTLASLPLSPRVTAHSIVAVLGEGPIVSLGDGVVGYDSAHVEGVASELVVQSPHSCQSHPDVELEVRRILREHLASLAAPTSAAAD